MSKRYVEIRAKHKLSAPDTILLKVFTKPIFCEHSEPSIDFFLRCIHFFAIYLNQNLGLHRRLSTSENHYYFYWHPLHWNYLASLESESETDLL